jgi:hypothetical protein
MQAPAYIEIGGNAMKTPMDKDLRKKIEAFCKKHGRSGAEIKLCGYGISKSMAQKLLAGTYPNQPEGLYLQALQEALGSK